MLPMSPYLTFPFPLLIFYNIIEYHANTALNCLELATQSGRKKHPPLFSHVCLTPLPVSHLLLDLLYKLNICFRSLNHFFHSTLAVLPQKAKPEAKAYVEYFIREGDPRKAEWIEKRSNKGR